MQQLRKLGRGQFPSTRHSETLIVVTCRFERHQGIT
jgi:hypothetical protein